LFVDNVIYRPEDFFLQKKLSNIGIKELRNKWKGLLGSMVLEVMGIICHLAVVNVHIADNPWQGLVGVVIATMSIHTLSIRLMGQGRLKEFKIK